MSWMGDTGTHIDGAIFAGLVGLATVVALLWLARREVPAGQKERAAAVLS